MARILFTKRNKKIEERKIETNQKVGKKEKLKARSGTNFDQVNTTISEDDLVHLESLEEWCMPCEEENIMAFENILEDNDVLHLQYFWVGKRGHHYRYVCIIQDVQGEHLKVLGIRCMDKTEKVFIIKEDDIFFINRSQVEEILLTPEMNAGGARLHYIF
ncbi:hypothetical protein PR048_015568 [Dryococelus australis]|uniref:Uncharacterized protein n=1 Tax=Dryococelus australis TaxID=614101 RepID=A0ABQ9HHD5_9NEOP|nr:hypothetical protein PR048_015568 [Dryococelus australis]